MDRKMYIDGQWCDASDGARIEAQSPATGETIGTVPQGTIEDVDRAVAAARRAQPLIEAMTVDERAAMVNRVADAIERHIDELAEAETLDQGKPLHAESKGEVTAAAAMWRTPAEVARWTDSQVLPHGQPDRLIYTIYQPRGVYGVVTPFNFPMALPQIYIPTALMAGNAVVWCPGPTVSWCTMALVEAMAEADLPPGALNVVTGDGPVVGDAIVSHTGTDAIVFVGSTGTGRIVTERAAGKPQILELGGNGPSIVLGDADVDMAVDKLAVACFINAGQVCTATERILVEDKAHDALLEAMTERAKTVKLGDPFDEATTMGPLNNISVVEKMNAHIADGTAKGSRLILGGKSQGGAPTPMYFEPTVIDGFAADSLFNREESFGPIAKMQSCANESQLLEVAGSCAYGLSASVFTNDLDRAMRLSRKIKAGLVHINEHTCTWDVRVPCGGFTGGGSGMGRIGGSATYLEMCNQKTIAMSWS